jgi:hypothetical protein
MSAAFSPTIMDAALVLPLGTVGKIDESTILNLALGIDDRHAVTFFANLAGARRVICRFYILTNPGIYFVICLHMLPGINLTLTELVEGWLHTDFSG